MSAKPTVTVEYLEPEVEAEALPDEFSASRLRRSLLTLGAIVLVVVGAIVLVPGPASLRGGAGGLALGAWMLREAKRWSARSNASEL